MTRTARRMFELLEPICLVTFLADECNEELAALSHRTYWDGYSPAAPRRWGGCRRRSCRHGDRDKLSGESAAAPVRR